jgi:hypothetical protein
MLTTPTHHTLAGTSTRFADVTLVAMKAMSTGIMRQTAPGSCTFKNAVIADFLGYGCAVF